MLVSFRLIIYGVELADTIYIVFRQITNDIMISVSIKQLSLESDLNISDTYYKSNLSIDFTETF